MTPDSTHGRLVAVVFGCWALTVSGTVIGLTADVPEVTAALDMLEAGAGRALGSGSPKSRPGAADVELTSGERL